MTENIAIDIWSDVACPWCYLGKKSLEKALEDFPHADRVDVRYHSYELAPDAPATDTRPVIDYLVEKKGLSRAQLQAGFDTITRRGAELGLEYRFDLARNANTRKAHRLIHLAEERGLDKPVIDALFDAYFTQGKPVGEDETLLGLAERAGLDRAEAEDALNSDEYDRRVAADVDLAGQLGIQGVPFFVIDGKYGVSGAQSVDTFGQVLDQVWQEKSDA